MDTLHLLAAYKRQHIPYIHVASCNTNSSPRSLGECFLLRAVVAAVATTSDTTSIHLAVDKLGEIDNEVPTHPSRARLGHAPGFSIEKRFALLPDMLADFHIFLSKRDLVVAPLTKDTSGALIPLSIPPLPHTVRELERESQRHMPQVSVQFKLRAAK
jgi:hypothetical protein